MRFFPQSILRSLGKLVLAAAGLLFLAAVPSGAESPITEIQSASILSSLDLARLKAGDVISQRAPLGKFPRGIQVQSCFFVNAPMAKVGETLLHFDASRHPNLDVRLYREFPLSRSAGDFAALRLSSAIADDRWLLEQSAKVAQGSEVKELHLSKEETTLLEQLRGQPNEAWRKILQGRSAALTRGGIEAVGPYSAEGDISPASEFRGLLSLAPKVARQFATLIAARPFGKANVPGPSVGFWEAAKVHDHTTLQLGVRSLQKEPNSWKLISCIYYPSDTYFMSIDFYQLWPLDDGTLVWNIGLVSAPFRSYLGGADRYVAGKLMTDDTVDTIKTIRRAVENRR